MYDNFFSRGLVAEALEAVGLGIDAWSRGVSLHTIGCVRAEAVLIPSLAVVLSYRARRENMRDRIGGRSTAVRHGFLAVIMHWAFQSRHDRG